MQFPHRAAATTAETPGTCRQDTQCVGAWWVTASASAAHHCEGHSLPQAICITSTPQHTRTALALTQLGREAPRARASCLHWPLGESSWGFPPLQCSLWGRWETAISSARSIPSLPGDTDSLEEAEILVQHWLELCPTRHLHSEHPICGCCSIGGVQGDGTYT